MFLFTRRLKSRVAPPAPGAARRRQDHPGAGCARTLWSCICPWRSCARSAPISSRLSSPAPSMILVGPSADRALLLSAQLDIVACRIGTGCAAAAGAGPHRRVAALGDRLRRTVACGDRAARAPARHVESRLRHLEEPHGRGVGRGTEMHQAGIGADEAVRSLQHRGHLAHPARGVARQLGQCRHSVRRPDLDDLRGRANARAGSRSCDATSRR